MTIQELRHRAAISQAEAMLRRIEAEQIRERRQRLGLVALFCWLVGLAPMFLVITSSGPVSWALTVLAVATWVPAVLWLAGLYEERS